MVSKSNDFGHSQNYYRLIGHTFFVKILENQRLLHNPLSEQAIQAYKSGQTPEPQISQELAYHSAVFHYSSNLVHSLERLEEVPIFLRRFPSSKYFSENGVTLHKWVSYHYSNYVVVYVSLYDIALLLTNSVFMLGINPRYCNEKEVAKHKLVRNTSVKTTLDGLNDTIQKYRDTRHSFVHRGRLPNLDMLDELEDRRFLHESMNEFGIEDQESVNPLMHPRVIKDLYKSEKRKMIKQIEEEVGKLTAILEEFFDSLQPCYEKFSVFVSNLESE